MRSKTILSIVFSSIVILFIVLCTLAGVADQLQQADNLLKNKQYDQAEQIYLSIAQSAGGSLTGQDIPEAFAAQKNIIILYITTNKLPQADTSYKQLLIRFADHNDMAQAIYDIARKYGDINKNDKARELYEYNVEHFPDDTHAMMSQTRIVKSHISDGNEPAANAAFNKLLTQFSQQPTLPEEIHYVAKKYEDVKEYDKAVEIYQYNVEHFPNNMYAMRSQVRIVRLYISDVNPPDFGELSRAAADTANAAFNKLLTFSDQPTLPKEIFKIANKFSEAGNNQKACQIYQYIIDTWSSTRDIDSRKFAVASYVGLGNEQEAQVQLDKLIANFRNHPNLTEAVFLVGEQYYYKAFRREKEGLAAEAKDYFKKALTVWEEAITQSSTSAFTPYAYYFSGYCHSRLGEYTKAMEYYQKAADNWPNFEYASDSQLRVARCCDMLAASGQISKSLAAKQIRQACEKLLANHPGSKGADEARGLLGRWTLMENTQ